LQSNSGEWPDKTTIRHDESPSFALQSVARGGTTVATYYLIAIFLLVAASAVVGYYLLLYQKHKSEIADIINDPNPLAAWTYTPQEWQQAVADEFSWGRADGRSAQVRICPIGIYVSDGAKHHLFELESGIKMVTFAGYTGIDGSPLKLRVRWRIERSDSSHRNETKYYKEDIRIPVPSREQDAALRVVDYFTQRLNQKPDAYAHLVPDDEPISLFGKDSF